jgi:hypothetical protein
MRQYEFPIRRTPFGVAAVGLSTLAFCVLIAAPASYEPCNGVLPVLAESKLAASYGTQVAISPATITVVGTRLDRTALDMSPHVPPKHGHAG